MRMLRRPAAVVAVVFWLAVPANASGGGADLKKEYAATLCELSRALLNRQIRDVQSPDD